MPFQVIVRLVVMRGSIRVLNSRIFHDSAVAPYRSRRPIRIGFGIGFISR